MEMDHFFLDADLRRDMSRLDEHSLDDQTKLFLEMSLGNKGGPTYHEAPIFQFNLVTQGQYPLHTYT